MHKEAGALTGQRKALAIAVGNNKPEKRFSATSVGGAVVNFELFQRQARFEPLAARYERDFAAVRARRKMLPHLNLPRRDVVPYRFPSAPCTRLENGDGKLPLSSVNEYNVVNFLFGSSLNIVPKLCAPPPAVVP